MNIHKKKTQETLYTFETDKSPELSTTYVSQASFIHNELTDELRSFKVAFGLRPKAYSKGAITISTGIRDKLRILYKIIKKLDDMGFLD